MIKLIGKVRTITAIACSGGVDSMAALSFIRNGGHDITALFLHHGTLGSSNAEEFLMGYCEEEEINLKIGRIQGEKPKNESWEEWWRNQRCGWLHSLKHTIAFATKADFAIQRVSIEEPGRVAAPAFLRLKFESRCGARGRAPPPSIFRQ